MNDKFKLNILKLNNIKKDLNNFEYILYSKYDDNYTKLENKKPYLINQNNVFYIKLNELMLKVLSHNYLNIYKQNKFNKPNSLNTFLKYINNDDNYGKHVDFYFDTELYDKINEIKYTMETPNTLFKNVKCIVDQTDQHISTISAMLIGFNFLIDNDFYNNVNNYKINTIYENAIKLFNIYVKNDSEGIEIAYFFNKKQINDVLVNYNVLRIRHPMAPLIPSLIFTSIKELVNGICSLQHNIVSGVISHTDTSYGFFKYGKTIYFFNTHHDIILNCAYILKINFNINEINKYFKNIFNTYNYHTMTQMYKNNKKNIEYVSDNIYVTLFVQNYD